MSDECIHLLGPATCTICNGRDRRERIAAQPVGWTRPFRARFPGRCGGCSEPVDVGDLVAMPEMRHVVSGRPVYHEGCAS